MPDYAQEMTLFHTVAPKIIALVRQQKDSNSLASEKDMTGDFATMIDVAVEGLIVSEIKQLFPDDSILAEEGHSTTQLSENRTWVIDPICGTTNLSRNIAGYCSNIALVRGDKVLASCVVDLAQSQYYWSTEDRAVFCGDEEYCEDQQYPGYLIDVDFGSVTKLTSALKKEYQDKIGRLLQIEGVMLTSVNSSLSILYVALGKVDGLLLSFTNPWDVCAGAFLAQQMQRPLVGIDGRAWTPQTDSLYVARDPRVLALIRDA